MNSIQSKEAIDSQFTWRVIWLLIIIVPESLTETILTPLFPFVVRNAMPGISEDNIGHYSGILGSAFYTPLFVMNLVWGAVSDKFGRRPVLYAGIFIYILASVVFAFAQNYWLLVACRFLAGTFGANSTVVKSMIGSLAKDEASRSWGYALYGSMYGFVGILGPILGGMLNDPVKLYPETFGNSVFFKSYPNSLPCLIGAGLALLSLYSLVFMIQERDFLDETGPFVMYDAIELDERNVDDEYSINHGQLRKQQPQDITGETDADSVSWNLARNSTDTHHQRHGFHEDELDSLVFEPHERDTSAPFRGQLDISATKGQETSLPISPSKHKELPLSHTSQSGFSFTSDNTILPIFLYSLIAYVNMTYVTSLPLFLSAPAPQGLGLNSRDESLIFTFSAVTKLIVQIFISNFLIQICGGIQGTFRYGMSLYLPIHFVIPFLNHLTGYPILLYTTTTILALLIGLAESMAYLAVIIFITQCTEPAYLGTAHGFAATIAALVRAMAPTIAGYLWELGLSAHMFWLVFWFGGCVSLCGVIATL